MRYQRYFSLLFLSTIFSSCLLAQGLNTTASKDDWEEINFEFNSPVLTDGYPSLLRLAELLQKHQDYKVKLEGHADTMSALGNAAPMRSRRFCRSMEQATLKSRPPHSVKRNRK
jgi:hypothetical protein